MSPAGDLGWVRNAGAKGAEVRWRGQAAGDGVHLALVHGPGDRAGGSVGGGQLLGGALQRVEQVLDAGPGDSDGEDQQHAVDGGLVDLDAVLVHEDVLAELLSCGRRMASN